MSEIGLFGNIAVDLSYQQKNYQELVESIKIYSSESMFDENTWVIDKKKKGSFQRKGDYSIYFSGTPDQYIFITKCFALALLHAGNSIKDVQSKVVGIKFFYNFLVDKYRSISIRTITKEILMDYECYIREIKTISLPTKENYWTALNSFFKVLKGWEEIPSDQITGRTNPFSRKSDERMVAQKYIPLHVIKQFDEVFHDKAVPLHLKTLYWICRLIPSRIGEITSLPIDCLKPYGDNQYVLCLNMYKQNGGYITPEKRLINIKYSDMGKYLIDLIKAQQALSNELQDRIGEKDRGYLFTYLQYYQYSTVEEILPLIDNHKAVILTPSAARKNLKKLAEKYDVRNEDNQIYCLTPHQLRHNAITDRMYEGFTLLEIRDMTHHKSTAMLTASYIHKDKEKIVAKMKEIQEGSTKQSGEVFFRGRIINPKNPLIIEKILQKPRAHSLGRIGICSDITGCKSELFECLGCEYFIPDADELPYFEEQAEQWRKKMQISHNHKFLFENAEYNFYLCMSIVNRIKNVGKGELN